MAVHVAQPFQRVSSDHAHSASFSDHAPGRGADSQSEAHRHDVQEHGQKEHVTLIIVEPGVGDPEHYEHYERPQEPRALQCSRLQGDSIEQARGRYGVGEQSRCGGHLDRPRASVHDSQQHKVPSFDSPEYDEKRQQQIVSQVDSEGPQHDSPPVETVCQVSGQR